MKRGDVVIVDFPFSDQSATKRHPALVVQADALNRSLPDTILASISTTAKRGGTHVQIDPQAEPNSGLNARCGVRCEKLLVVDKRNIRGAIGELSAQAMRSVDDCLRQALEL